MRKGSICHSCVFSRKTWSDKRDKEGYVGCIIRASKGKEPDVQAEIVGEGWIRAHDKPRSEKPFHESGHVVNLQIITKNAFDCDQFKQG